MCKHCYRQKSSLTKRDMFHCKLRNDGENENAEILCGYQRYCRTKNDYIENEMEKCKDYECV